MYSRFSSTAPSNFSSMEGVDMMTRRRVHETRTGILTSHACIYAWPRRGPRPFVTFRHPPGVTTACGPRKFLYQSGVGQGATRLRTSTWLPYTHIYRHCMVLSRGLHRFRYEEQFVLNISPPISRSGGRLPSFGRCVDTHSGQLPDGCQ